MAGAIDRFRREAEARGLSLDVRTFPEGTKTADAAARAVGCEVGQIVKSLVFVGDGQPLLALTSGANRADPGRLADVRIPTLLLLGGASSPAMRVGTEVIAGALPNAQIVVGRAGADH